MTGKTEIVGKDRVSGVCAAVFVVSKMKTKPLKTVSSTSLLETKGCFSQKKVWFLVYEPSFSEKVGLETLS